MLNRSTASVCNAVQLFAASNRRRHHPPITRLRSAVTLKFCDAEASAHLLAIAEGKETLCVCDELPLHALPYCNYQYFSTTNLHMVLY